MDSDSDGILDYYEKKVSVGELLLGTGSPLKYFGNLSYLNPDSDGDGLKDGDELEIKSLPFAGGKLIHYVYMSSNPCMADSDGDGYADGFVNVFCNDKFNAPRPLINDVVVTKLKNADEWIKIDGYSSISDGVYSYGGRQWWMGNSSFSPNADNVLNSGGCGIVAGSDVITYLAMKNGNNYPLNISGIDVFYKGVTDKFAIGSKEYTDYLLYMGNNHFEPWTGIPGFMSAGTTTWGITPQNYVKYFNNLNIGYKATAKGVHPNHTPPGMGAIIAIQKHRDNLLEEVKKSIKNDIPVTILYLFNNAKHYDYDKYLQSPLGDEIWNHWINATEVIEDKIANKTILTISNWGRKQQIIWEEFVYAFEYVGLGNRVVFYG